MRTATQEPQELARAHAAVGLKGFDEPVRLFEVRWQQP